MQPRMPTPEEKNPDVNILVIGAGPVGLRFVIEMLNQARKTRKKNIVIGIIERNKTYTRTQELTLHAELSECDEQLKTQIQLLVANGQARKDSENNIHILIQDLETCLATYANDLGVNIHHKRFMTIQQYKQLLDENEIKDRAELEKKLNSKIIVGREEIAQCYPNCKIIIGADGSRSSVRQLISGKDEDESVDKKDLRYLIEIKYLAKGKVKKLNKINYYRIQAFLHGFLCSESVKYLEDKNQTQITLRYLVDEKTYHDPRLNHINAKNLLPLCGDFPLPSLLQKVINTWLSFRGDEFVVGSGTINKTILSVYSSHLFGTADQTQIILLLGDAANGFPYMNGWKMGATQAIQAAALLNAKIVAINNNDLASMNALVREFSIMTKEIFDKGYKIAVSKDYEITNKRRLAKSMHISSSIVKIPEQSLRERDHLVFSGISKQCSLDLTELNDYVEKYSGHSDSESFQLSMALLVHLITHQRTVYQDPEQIDFYFLKAVLNLACFKNKAIIAREKSFGFLSSLAHYAEEPIERKKFRSEITSNEIENAIQFSPVVITREPVQDTLHHIIYQLFKSVVRIEQKYHHGVVFEEKTEEKNEPSEKSSYSHCAIS